MLKPGKHHYKKPNNVSKTDKHEQYNESESEIRRNTSSQSPSVVIVGDSMIKHLDKRRLQRSITSKPHKVRMETYSGANIAAMKHHIKPCLESKPEKIILHVGTNNLYNKEATEIAEGIIEVGQLIKQESRKTEIIISQIVNRTDKAGMTKKMTEVNELLEHYCKLNKWALIKHSNIDSNHLNSYIEFLHYNYADLSIGSFQTNLHDPCLQTNLHDPCFQTNLQDSKLNSKIKNTSGFKIAQLNIRSLIRHIDQFRYFLKDKQIDIICLNETLLDETIDDHEVNIIGYEILRKDRNRNGGGVAVYVRNIIKYNLNWGFQLRLDRR